MVPRCLTAAVEAHHSLPHYPPLHPRLGFAPRLPLPRPRQPIIIVTVVVILLLLPHLPLYCMNHFA